MNVTDANFVKGFIRMCDDGWQQGWHERNGGNLTYRMKDTEVAEVAASIYHGFILSGSKEVHFSNSFSASSSKGTTSESVSYTHLDVYKRQADPVSTHAT